MGLKFLACCVLPDKKLYGRVTNVVPAGTRSSARTM